MDPVITNNTKARVNLACPVCGMDLKKAPNGGFAKYGETYCCSGCADATGCTCYAGTEGRRAFNRPGDIGWRNAENRLRDANFNAEQDTSSRPIGKRKHATAREMPSRDQRGWDPRSKRLKSANKRRDSTRQESRGQSEERGRLALPATPKLGSRAGNRVSRTGGKGK